MVKKNNKARYPVEGTSMMCEMEISALGGKETCLALLKRQDSQSEHRSLTLTSTHKKNFFEDFIFK